MYDDDEGKHSYDVRAVFRDGPGPRGWHNYFTTDSEVEAEKLAADLVGQGASRIAVYEDGRLVDFEDFRTIEEHQEDGRRAARMRALSERISSEILGTPTPSCLTSPFSAF